MFSVITFLHFSVLSPMLPYADTIVTLWYKIFHVAALFILNVIGYFTITVQFLAR